MQNHQHLKVSLVVPVLNEEGTVGIFIDKLHELFRDNEDISLDYVFVNDGSTDATLARLLERQKNDKNITVVDLSRNFGKEAALTAGLREATGDVVIPMDVDLQDPPELIHEMLAKWREGYEVVLGRRVNRDSDSFIKRTSAGLFYRIHNKLASPKLPENVGDFRLMDRAVVEALKDLPESRRFMKGLFAWIGFRTTCVDYARPGRIAGTTKFNGWKLWNFALEGFTSFSTAPLKIWTYIGFCISVLSFLYISFLILRVLAWGVDVPGYASLMVMIAFFGGLQLMGIGILGEYIGRIYMESKRRPSYIARRIYRNME